MVATDSTEQTYTLKDWQRGYDSQPHEYDYWIEDIEGSIPSELQGTLYRNGPGLLDVNGQPIPHPFDGDGMICAITLNKGRAYFRNRFVQTDGYLAEQKAGKILYRGFGTQKPGGWRSNIFDLKFKNVANTNVIHWNGKLWAMWEGGNPHHLDPATLETVGLDRIEGILTPNQPFSAHPKIINDKNGQSLFVNFGVNVGLSSQLKIFEIDPQGRLINSYSHKIKGFAFLHDILITPNYYLFLHNPFAFEALPFVLGQRSISHCLRFDTTQPTRIIMIPRNGNHEVKTLETDPCFAFHHANAWEENGTVYIDSICYDSFPNIEPDTDFRNLDFIEFPHGQLCRFQIDPTRKTVEHSIVEDRSCEMPAVHPDVFGQPYRFLYLNGTHQPSGSAPLQAILKIDWQTNERQIWSAAPRGFVSEPVFVPRPNRTDEDEGWLLTLVYDAAQHRSNLAILDARNISSGPLARLNLKHHVPHGFHGTWSAHCFV